MAAGTGHQTGAGTASSPNPCKSELPHHPLPPPPPLLPISSISSRKHSAASLTNSPIQDSSSVASANPSKRKRGPGDVTQNACTECRKKRAKVSLQLTVTTLLSGWIYTRSLPLLISPFCFYQCDGQHPCGRCRAHGDVECIYEKRVNPSKDELRVQIAKLRVENELLKQDKRVNSQVIGALVHPDLGDGVLARLRNGMSVHDVSQWVGEMAPSGAGTLPSQAHAGFPPGTGPGIGHGIGAHPLAGFTAAPGPGPPLGYGPVAPGLATPSPITTQPQQSLRYEPDQQSPGGGHFSPLSRTTRSNSYAEGMNWDSETVRGLPHSRVVSRPETSGDSSAKPHSIPALRNILEQAGYEGAPVPPNGWTKITSDGSLVTHLLSLYFCWEYPTFASLSKEHFLKDFSEGRTRFCSSILVNALLALGCRFSSKPTTRAVPHDPYTSGDHFFREALRLFTAETDHHKLTTIQALGIMSIREASCGRDSESWYYAGQSIRLAIEMGLHEIQGDGRDDDLTAVQAATFWGAFALDQ